MLTVKKYVENYTHTLTYTFGKLNGVVVEKTGNTEIQWTPQLEAFAAEQTGPVPTEGELRLTTYAEDGSVVGTNRYSFTAKLPEDVVPQITSLLLEPISDSVPAEWFALVQGKSRVRYIAYADGLYGAGIKSCVFSFGNQTVEGERGETKILNTAGSFEPTLTVTDTRNRTATVKMAAWEVFEYSPPTLDASYAYRSDGAGNKGDGTYVTAYGKASCYSVGGNNSVALRMRSRTRGGEWKDDYPALTSGIERRFPGFDKDKTYEVEIYAVDTIGERTPVPYIIETERVSLHLKEDKDGGAAFGKYAEDPAKLQCAWDAQFDKNVSVEGDLTVDGTLETRGNLMVGGSLVDNLHFDKTDPRIHIADNQSGTKLGICAGRENHDWDTDGASLFLYQNNSNNKGFFTLSTGKVDGQQQTLYGKPNGDLIWGDKWINPPMVPGTEYPTIERFNGKIVFAKVVDCGNMPASATKYVAHGVVSGATYVSVRLVFQYGDTACEVVKGGEGDEVINISGANIKIVCPWSAAAYRAYAFLKYVK